jgi:hypothetical protein
MVDLDWLLTRANLSSEFRVFHVFRGEPSEWIWLRRPRWLSVIDAAGGKVEAGFCAGG